MNRRYKLAVAASLVALTGCATYPTGPSYSAMPGSRKGIDQFQYDDAACRNYATKTTGTPNESAADAGLGSAVVGTVLGAAVGGLLGGGQGARVGAGVGLFGGAIAGTGNAEAARYTTQQRLDNVYYQCMYGAGHKVPMPASYARSLRQASAAPAPYRGAPPPNAAIPPPNTPPPDAAMLRPDTPPPNAAIPPPNAPPPYRQR